MALSMFSFLSAERRNTAAAAAAILKTEHNYIHIRPGASLHSIHWYSVTIRLFVPGACV